MTDNQRGPNYYLRSADISSPRFTTEEGPIDISKIILEINLYENLMVPYITGDILIADTEGLSNIIKRPAKRLSGWSYTLLKMLHW